MKSRFFNLLGLSVTIGMLAWLGVVFAQLRSVPSAQFADAIRTQSSARLVAYHTGSLGRLPLWLRIRFPKETLQGATGFPDRTDVYTLHSGTTDFQCIAYVRRDEVCFVSIQRKEDAGVFASAIQKLFPGLTVK